MQFNHGNRPLFLVTVQDGSQSKIENALTEAYDVGQWTLIGQAGETRRYQVLPALSLEEQLGEYLDDLAGLEALSTADAIIERIDVVANGWRETGWFADRDAFSKFSSFWQRNANFRLHRLTQDGESEPSGDGLTHRQHEPPRIAYELGFSTSRDRLPWKMSPQNWIFLRPPYRNDCAGRKPNSSRRPWLRRGHHFQTDG